MYWNDPFFSELIDMLLYFRKEANLELEGNFLIRNIYNDEDTYNVVGAASKVLSELELQLIWGTAFAVGLLVHPAKRDQPAQSLSRARRW